MLAYYLAGAFVGALTLLVVYLYVVVDRVLAWSVRGKHVVVTGGSSGIGLSVAEQLLRAGAHVTIMARNPKRLEEAITELKPFIQAPAQQKLLSFSADVSDPESIESAMHKCHAAVGRLDAVVASAGVTKPCRFENLTARDFQWITDINYLGAVNTVRAALPMLKEQKHSRISLVSSMGGLVGVAGFTAYAGSKFAVRGFAEALQMEVRPFGVRVCVVNPPDVDTPMYQEEMKIKPEECRLISEGSGLFSSEKIAKDIVDGMRNYRFFVQTGFDGVFLGWIAAGMSPETSILSALIQAFGLGLLRIISLSNIWQYNRICSRVYAKEAANNAKETTSKKTL
eukprot:CAMPEP_0174231618 /NCGR_PEP_ID=MMETSP0417-20130205/2116_1 /TAXON_ID=242541 /ORGANISM="Mayorella sp, Strain BSH-02190019" /LENGTH=339 /DNA_ID=CAMNT_0015309539 /DNA_START=65 /DNA_END=1084 /DNA_ORIENTATION=+